MTSLRLPDGRTVQVDTDNPSNDAHAANRFRVTAPDGRSFVVNAPEGATAEEALARAQAHAASGPQHSAKNTIGGLAGDWADGMIPGAAGAIRGVRQALVNAVQAPFSDKVDFHPVDSYREGRAFQEARQKQANKDHPGLATTAQVGGLVAGLALPAAKVARGAGIGAKILAGAKTAGGYGALSGALSSKSGTAGGVLADALTSGATGASVGAALPVVARSTGVLSAPVARPLAAYAAPKAGRVLQKVGGVVPGALGNVFSREGAQLARDPAQAAAHVQLDREIRAATNPATGAALRPMDVVQEVQRRQSLGVPAVPADLDDGLRRRLGASARSPGPATSIVRRHLDERKQQETARTVRHIAESLGPVTNVERQLAELDEQAKAAAKPLYDRAYAQSVPLTRELQALMSRPAARQALSHAAVSLENDDAPALAHGLIEGEDGVWREGKVPTMQAYDHAKTALDDTVFAGQSPFAPADVSRDMRGALSTRRRLLELMDGDGSGPRTTQTLRSGVPEAPPASQTSPSSPMIGHDPDAVPADLPGPWTGQRLHPEPEAGPQAASEARGSSVPPEGLNPFWKPARDAYAGPTQNRKALELGEEMARASATDAASRMDGMTGSQLDHFRLGHRTGLAADVRTLPDYADAASRVSGALEKRDATRAVHGERAAGALSSRLDPEQDASLTWQAVRGGPGAVDLGEQDRQIEDAAKGVLQTLSGHPGTGLGNVAKALARGDRGGREVNGRIASVLAEPNVGILSSAIRDVGRERARRTLVDRNVTGALLQGGRTAGALFGPNLVQPFDDYDGFDPAP